MLQGRNSARTKPPSVSNQEQLGKVPHMKMIMSCSRTGPTLTRPCSTKPLENKRKARVHFADATLHVSRGFSSSSAILPPSLNLHPSKGLVLASQLVLIYPLPLSILPLFPASRAVITLELRTFDQPEQKFFTELLFGFYCASATLLHLRPVFLHVHLNSLHRNSLDSSSLTPSVSCVA